MRPLVMVGQSISGSSYLFPKGRQTFVLMALSLEVCGELTFEGYLGAPGIRQLTLQKGNPEIEHRQIVGHHLVIACQLLGNFLFPAELGGGLSLACFKGLALLSVPRRYLGIVPSSSKIRLRIPARRLSSPSFWESATHGAAASSTSVS